MKRTALLAALLLPLAASAGSTAKEAYFVKVDRETTTQNDSAEDPDTLDLSGFAISTETRQALYDGDTVWVSGLSTHLDPDTATTGTLAIDERRDITISLATSRDTSAVATLVLDCTEASAYTARDAAGSTELVVDLYCGVSTYDALGRVTKSGAALSGEPLSIGTTITVPGLADDGVEPDEIDDN